MTQPRTRRLNRILASALLAALASGAVHLSAQPPAPSTGSGQAGLRVEISFSAAAHSGPVTGMVYLAISRDNQSAPIQQTDPEGVPLFPAYVERLEPGTAAVTTRGQRRQPLAS